MSDTDSRSVEHGDPDFSTRPVPVEARMSKGSLAMAYWALCSAAFWLVLTATFAYQLGSVNTLVAMVASVVCYGYLGGVVARFAIRTGFSVDLFSRVVFGKVGGLLATAIFSVTAVYYCVFEGSVIALAFAEFLPFLKLWHAYLLVVVYSVPLIFGGVSAWLDRFNGLLLPFYILGLIALIVLAYMNHGYTEEWLALGDHGGVLDGRAITAFNYYMGFAVIIMYSWDFSRFGKNEDEEFHAKISFGIPFYSFTLIVNGLVGMYLAATVAKEQTLNETSIVFVILELMGLAGLAFLWVSQTRINTANFQEATVNLQALLKHITNRSVTKISAALLIGVAVFITMLTDVFSFLLAALAYQGVFVVAWIAIAITHIMGSDENKIAMQFTVGAEVDDGVLHQSLIVWVLGSCLGVYILNFSESLGSYSGIITAFVASGLYYSLLKLK